MAHDRGVVQLRRMVAMALLSLWVALSAWGVLDARAEACFDRGSCAGCLSGDGLCDWIPEHYSCAPRSGEDDFLSGLKRISDKCDDASSFDVPPAPFRHQCANNGILSLKRTVPFGAYCDCPRGYIGSKCQVCDPDTQCPSGTSCVRDIRGLDPGDHRSLSCECTSDFCEELKFGPGNAIVNIDIYTGSGRKSSSARVEILKAVKVPDNKTFKSPVVISANLSHCTSGEEVPCIQACGDKECPKEVIWGKEDTCRIWTCDGPPNSKPDDYTSCPGSTDWSENALDCNLIKGMMVPSFQFVCVVPSEPNMPLVDGKVNCGFATALLPQGMISLRCGVGSCVEGRPTVAPTSQGNNTRKHSKFESLFFCSGAYGDQNCWSTYYLLILLVPSLYTLGILFAVTSKERRTKATVQAARILSTQLLDSNFSQTDADAERGEQQDTSRLLSRGQPEYLQSSPLLSYSNISFGIYDSTSAVDAFGRRVGSVRLKRRGFRTVLHNISGHCRPGELCAIMGPSGSGKTSLLDILAGRKNVGRIAGQICLDGVVASPEDLRDCVGYVTQDDVLPSTSTVRELLLFHATLRGNSTMPLLTRCERVQDVLNELGLANCADSMVGGAGHKSISGGERRRTSIACELLGEHTRLLVMDEPTSGLDSNSTQSVISALQTVVETERKTVILSIHQPSSALFRRFSRVVLLSATGRLLFVGPIEAIETFFPPYPPGTNPAEYLIDLCVGDSDEAFRQAADRYEGSSVKADEVIELRNLLEDAHTRTRYLPSAHRPTLRLQVVELSARAVRNAWRHPVLAATNVVATLFVGVSCGLLYRGVTNDLQGAINRAGLFFFFLCFLMLASIADLGVFQEERLILMRERASGAYSALAWFASKVFVEILILRLAPLAITTFLLTGLVGLNQRPNAVFALYVLLLVISLTATLQFLCIGMLFTQSGVANFASILLTMFSLLMSGFLLQFDGTGANSSHSKDKHPTETSGFEFLQKFSVLHFGFEALMVNELHGLDFEIVVKTPDGEEMTRVGATGDLILAQLGFRYDRFANDVMTVLVFFAAFCLVTLVLLQFVVVEKR